MVRSAHPDMVESCQAGARLPCFFWLSREMILRPQRGGTLERRWITLIYAGWVPPDLASSRSCLSLRTGVSACAYSLRAYEGSPYRGRAPLGPENAFYFFSLTAPLLLVFFKPLAVPQPGRWPRYKPPVPGRWR